MADQTQPPLLCNFEAERAVVGAALINPGVLDELDLVPDDFYQAQHRIIWEAAQGLWHKGLEPDYVTLLDVIGRAGKGEYVTLVDVIDMINSTPTSLAAEGYSRIVKDYARRRRVVRVLSEAAAAAYRTGERVDKIVTELIDALGKDSGAGRPSRKLADILTEMLPDIRERRDNPTNTPGIPFGLLDVDNLLGGLKPGEMVYIAGEPGVGKSLLMLFVALNMGKGGYPGAIFSLEMRSRAVAMRALSALSLIPTRDIETGKTTPEQHQSIEAAISQAGDVLLTINDDPHLTLASLRSELVRLRAQHGIEWFALDYLLLLNGYDKLNETERSSVLSRGVRQIANDLGLCALTVNSVTKEAMGEGASVSNKNVRGGGGVVHDADAIFFLTSTSQKNILHLTATKLRNVTGGAGKTIALYKDPSLPIFRDVETRSVNGR